eukprot:403336215
MQSSQLAKNEKCVSCKEMFDMKQRQKVFIQCGDFYCLTCLSLISPQDDFYFCNRCEENVRIPQKLIDNIYKLMKDQQETIITCKLHPDQNAEYYCNKCSTFSCKQCILEQHCKQHLESLKIVNQHLIQLQLQNNLFKARYEIQQFDKKKNQLQFYKIQARKTKLNSQRREIKSSKNHQNNLKYKAINGSQDQKKAPQQIQSQQEIYEKKESENVIINEILPENYIENGENSQTSVQSEDEEVEPPILIVDLNMGGTSKERIVVYQEDIPEDIAHEFAIKHQLDDDLRDRLVEMLEVFVNQVKEKNEKENEEQEQGQKC